MYTRTHTYVHTCISAYIGTCLHSHTYICAFIHTLYIYIFRKHIVSYHVQEPLLSTKNRTYVRGRLNSMIDDIKIIRKLCTFNTSSCATFLYGGYVVIQLQEA